MSDSFWVMTGAAGGIAQALRPGLRDLVGRWRLLDSRPVPDGDAHGDESRVVDLRDRAALIEAVRGATGVVHLGGLASEADREDIVEVNVLGTAHVLEAARQAGARRVVLASSNHATGFYGVDERIGPGAPPRPDSFYGVSKVAGEALGSLYVDKFGLEVACIRIGHFAERPETARDLSIWISPRDTVAAFSAAMTFADLRFSVFYGVSANTRGWWDIEPGRRIGYEPRDDAEAYAGTVPPVPDDETGRLQGGEFVPAAATLDPQR
ncbi:NAD-dependent epimerase/dehydratase family protein [Motilibacter deserti]|uniref:NAD-dependent epimerase/dehydratase family protein n=1 Tax=Motilibacter deserti TaxID=2714956 RepID=UPI002F2B3918